MCLMAPGHGDRSAPGWSVIGASRPGEPVLLRIELELQVQCRGLPSSLGVLVLVWRQEPPRHEPFLPRECRPVTSWTIFSNSTARALSTSKLIRN